MRKRNACFTPIEHVGAHGDNGSCALADAALNTVTIAQAHGLDFQTTNMDFADDKAAIEWIIRNQFGRRNLPAYERARLALELKPIIAERAKENQRKAGGALP